MTRDEILEEIRRLEVERAALSAEELRIYVAGEIGSRGTNHRRAAAIRRELRDLRKNLGKSLDTSPVTEVP